MKISEIEELVTNTLSSEVDYANMSSTLNVLLGEIKERETQIGQFSENNQKLVGEVANLKKVNYDYFCKLNVSEQSPKNDNKVVNVYPSLEDCLK